MLHISLHLVRFQLMVGINVKSLMKHCSTPGSHLDQEDGTVSTSATAR